MSKVVVNFSLDAETTEMLDRLSKEKKMPKSMIIRELLKREDLPEVINNIELKNKVDELIRCLNDPLEMWEHPYVLFIIYELSLLIDADLTDALLEDKDEFRDLIRKSAQDYWSDDNTFKPDDIDAFADKAFNVILGCIKIKRKALEETKV